MSWHLVTLFVGPLTQLVSARTIGFISTTLVTTGVLASDFAPSFSVMVLTYGVLIGCGTGISSANDTIIIIKYFKIKTKTAIGLFATSLGVAQIITPQILKYF